MMATIRHFRILAPVILLSLPISLACVSSRGQGPAPAAAPEGWTAYGASVTLSDRTPVADILARPDDFVGRTVAVEGTVTEVCTMMGCWVEVSGAEGSRIRLKVNDGEIVFPSEAVGRRAVLEGKVEKLTFTREEFVAQARHEAEERGVPFDPESVQPPYETIRLWGSGAWIEER